MDADSAGDLRGDRAADEAADRRAGGAGACGDAFSSGDCQTSGRLHETVERNLTVRITDGEMYMFEYYANSTMAEVLREAGKFDLIHYHLSSAWIPLARATGMPGLFTMHTSPHLDDEWVMKRWPQVAVAGISECQMAAAALKLGREFPVVYNGCDFGAYEPRFEGEVSGVSGAAVGGEKSSGGDSYRAGGGDAAGAGGAAAE